MLFINNVLNPQVAALFVACAVALPNGARQQAGRALEAEATTTPKPIVPILKHINQVNDDGSYTFGYEAGDGSFRLETKDVSGKVTGMYPPLFKLVHCSPNKLCCSRQIWLHRRERRAAGARVRLWQN